MQAIQSWLQQVLPGAIGLSAASSDASFRRYFRTECDGATYIVMDAPPSHEDCGPFIHVSQWLKEHEIAAAYVLQQDLEQGFLLLNDLGSQTMLEALETGPQENYARYQRAIALLVDMQQKDIETPLAVPDYDSGLLEREMDLFRDWYVQKLRAQRWDDEIEAHWVALKNCLITECLKQPMGLVHRDYHSRNLMVQGDGSIATIDFQDAVRGPRSYDLISLLRDCYWELSQQDYDSLRELYRQRAQEQSVLPPSCSASAFAHDCSRMAVQRHLKASGIFSRLWLRDGKRGYLADIPRTLGYVRAVCAVAEEPELQWLGDQLAVWGEPSQA